MTMTLTHNDMAAVSTQKYVQCSILLSYIFFYFGVKSSCIDTCTFRLPEIFLLLIAFVQIWPSYPSVNTCNVKFIL